MDFFLQKYASSNPTTAVTAWPASLLPQRKGTPAVQPNRTAAKGSTHGKNGEAGQTLISLFVLLLFHFSFSRALLPPLLKRRRRREAQMLPSAGSEVGPLAGHACNQFMRIPVEGLLHSSAHTAKRQVVAGADRRHDQRTATRPTSLLAGRDYLNQPTMIRPARPLLRILQFPFAPLLVFSFDSL